ncbi:MAG: phytanoyl-CoA dioxygenase [Gemmatimonadetes bacterium]|nr:phytanoyl-CoA dioxygenase [Gemmatimonadota bacterium]HCK10840.1 phytanoyl-CoA dioxygenase [Candidatus Latescibacterota bacterium]
MSEHLISSKDMARFVASGYLRYEDIVPKDLCEACRTEMESFGGYLSVGMPFEETWPKEGALGETFRLPKVKGLIESLVGPDPLYDHHAAHLVKAGQLKGPDMHQDSVIDFREDYFDIQLSFFPMDTPDEMGGTFLIPGTHFRNVRTGEISGYQHMVGKVWASCPAGTVYVWNTRVWHGARSNHTDQHRYMFKLRLNPTQPQIRNFDTSDLQDPEIGTILNTRHGWEGNEMRYELMKRVEQWRYVSDQPDYDQGERFLRRREYQPQKVA